MTARLDIALLDSRREFPDFRPHLLKTVDKVLEEDARFEVLFTLIAEACRVPEDLRGFLHRWVYWNRGFAGYVATLAGWCHQMDPKCMRPSARDTHPAFIASKVFAAAVDEYAQGTHAACALDFLESFLGENLDPESHYDPMLLWVCSSSKSGYNPQGLGWEVSGAYQALGFHIASERFASQEFDVLDRVLRSLYPDRVRACEDRGTYGWVADHKGLEIDHFENALEAAELAHHGFDPVLDPKSESMTAIERGMLAFESIQMAFFNSHRHNPLTVRQS